MSDGKITFSTKLDNKDMQKQLTNLSKAIDRAMGEKSKAVAAKSPFEKKLDSIAPKLEEAKRKLEEYRKSMENAQAAISDPKTSSEDMAAARAALKEDSAGVINQTKEVERLQSQWDTAQNKVQAYDDQIARADQFIQDATAEAAGIREKLDGAGEKFKNAMNTADGLVKGISGTIAKIARRVFVLKMITSVLRSAREYFGQLVSTSAEYQNQVAKLRGALATAFQPLYEAALPICLAVLRVLTDIANVAAHIFSGLFGKTAKQSADNAKALNKEAEAIKGVGAAAKEAAGGLASFDEINKLEDESQSSGGGGYGSASPSMDFSDIGDELTETQARIAEILKGVLLVAAGLKLWKLSQNLEGGLGTLTRVMGGLLFVIGGIILLWDGFKDAMENGMDLSNLFEIEAGLLAIGAGISIIVGGWIPLLIAGIAGALMALAYFTGHGDELIQGLRDTFGGMVDFVVALIHGDWAGAMEGIERTITGLQEIAVALLESLDDGFASLMDWLNEITGGLFEPLFEGLKTAWSGVMQFLEDIFTGSIFTAEYWKEKAESIGNGIAEIGKAIGNLLISMINELIALINSMGMISIPAGPFGAWDAADVQLWNIPEIPLLARGAVIPPNAPFMAMLGDQRNGTNLEAPEDLIRQIVREEAGNTARVEALLEELIAAVAGIRVGDEVIGRMANRYNARADRALGR